MAIKQQHNYDDEDAKSENKIKFFCEKTGEHQRCVQAPIGTHTGVGKGGKMMMMMT